MYRSSADNIMLNPNDPLNSSNQDEKLEELELYSCENDDAPMNRSIAAAEPPVVSTSG